MRQFIWSLIALLLSYGGWQVIRALFVGSRQKTDSQNIKNQREPILGNDFLNYLPKSSKEPELGSTVAVYSHNQPDIDESNKLAEDSKAPLDSFAVELELQRLRLELGAMRETFEAQQKEISSLQVRLEHSSKPDYKRAPITAAPEPDTSPEYDEALALARRGMMADAIASRCGITRAEADLVASLAARGKQREAARKLS